MIAAIVGSRDFNDYDKLCKFIYKTCIDENYSIREIVSGGARGADKLGEQFAKNYNLSLKIYEADWQKYGRRAGFVRKSVNPFGGDLCFGWLGSLRLYLYKPLGCVSTLWNWMPAGKDITMHYQKVLKMPEAQAGLLYLRQLQETHP